MNPRLVQTRGPVGAERLPMPRANTSQSKLQRSYESRQLFLHDLTDLRNRHHGSVVGLLSLDCFG